jgi:chromate reductase
MTKESSVAVLVGSLRKESWNRKIALALLQLAPNALKLRIVEIGGLPLYNEDGDNDGKAPVEWSNFRVQIQSADAVLFITPEYNRSVPAALKNAIDVGSRPYGKSVWNSKPGAVISSSVGGIGGFGANHHLRQSLVSLNVPVLQQPEAYIGNVAGLFDASGQLNNDGTRDFLRKFMDIFAHWIETNRKE